MAWIACAACAAMLSTAPSFAQSPDIGGLRAGGAATGLKQGRTEIEAGYGHESLTNNFADWKESYLLAAHDFGGRRALYGGVRETRRFGLDDTEAHAGLYYPLGATWNSVVEARVSPTHDVLAKYSMYGQLQKMLPGGWGIGLGLRRNEYNQTASNVTSLETERYWGNFRGAYTLYSGRPEGASSASSHRLQFGYYYADRSSVSLSYSTGREVEYVGPARGVITTDVQNWTLSGRHWLTPTWALTYDVTTHEQGSLYRRQGLRLGIRHSF